MAQEKKERIFISYKRVDKDRVFAIKDGIGSVTFRNIPIYVVETE